MKYREFEVAKLNLEDGDFLVFRVSRDNYNMVEYEALVSYLRKIFECIDKDIRGMCIWDDVKISILRKDTDLS